MTPSIIQTAPNRIQKTPDTIRGSKRDSVCAGLRAMAYKLGAGAQLPTIDTLQKQFEVTVVTISRALERLEDEQVVQRRHGRGVFVSADLLRPVCVLCDPSFFHGAGVSPFWSILLEQLNELATLRNLLSEFHFTMPYGHSGDPLHPAIIADLLSGRIYGLVVLGGSPALVQVLNEHGIPFVGFASAVGERSVQVDEVSLIREGVRCLMEEGCRRIGLWKPVSPFRPGDRYSVESTAAGEFQTILKGFGLPFDPALVREQYHLLANPLRQTTYPHQVQGYHTVMEVFGREAGVKPDGIVIMDDLMAQGALTAFHKTGYRVGQDIRIATHVNRGAVAVLGYESEVTRLEIDPEDIASALYRILDSLVQNDGTDRSTVFIQPKVIRRISSPV